MGDKSGIQWTDATWNPVTGCSKVSPGCANCYAEALAVGRFKGAKGYPGLPWTPENAATNVVLHPDRLDQPLRWTKPRMVFVNSMSDLFHERVPDKFIAAIFAVMAAAHQHTFQILTKRPERMRDFVNYFYDHCAEDPPPAFGGGTISFDGPAPNIWLGVSIENRRFVHRADLLRETPAAVRFVSAEPLLGPLVGDGKPPDWRCTNCRKGIRGNPRFCPHCNYTVYEPVGAFGKERWTDGYDGPELELANIDWLIVGGESGPHHRMMDPEWARDLRDSCADAWIVDGERIPKRTAFFFKQWGGKTAKAGGRELDGRTWDEMPEASR